MSRCGDMNRVPEIKMFSTMGAMRCPIAHEILGRIRRHFVGRVVTLIALIQTTEQPANAVVCALGRAASATWARIILAVAGFIALYPAVVLFGIKGVIAICIIEAVVYRLYLRILASRKRKIPFQDHVAVFGSSAIFAEIVYVHWAVPPLTLQLALVRGTRGSARASCFAGLGKNDSRDRRRNGRVIPGSVRCPSACSHAHSLSRGIAPRCR